jgi:hypothetical protein
MGGAQWARFSLFDGVLDMANQCFDNFPVEESVEEIISAFRIPAELLVTPIDELDEAIDQAIDEVWNE